jgi:hypothetical protein
MNTDSTSLPTDGDATVLPPPPLNPHRQALVRYWWGVCLKCLAALAFIGVLGAFLKLQDRQSELRRLRNEGVVSRAVVTEKDVDTVTTKTRRGGSSSYEVRTLRVRHNPKSPVKFADVGTKVPEADLPPPLPDDRDAPIGFIRVDTALFEKTQVGDVLTVVNTPYSPNSPEFYIDVRDFSAAGHYQFMALCAGLAVGFYMLARRFTKPQAA